MIIINNLINVSNNDGILTVSSREVSKSFNKQHGHILRDIDILIENMGSIQNWSGYFIPSEYQDQQMKNRKEYLLTKDGFSLLVMGFTGSKALDWKLRYIEAFNKMEESLNNKKDHDLEFLKELNKTLKSLGYIQDRTVRDYMCRQLLEKVGVKAPMLQITNEMQDRDNKFEIVKRFIEETCVIDKNSMVTVSDLYKVFSKWSKEDISITKIALGKNIRKLGLNQGKSDKFRFWENLKVK